MKDLLEPVLDLLLPAVCPACGRAPGRRLCAACRAGMSELAPACPRCAYPLADDEACRFCDGRGLPHLATARCGWLYRGTIAHLVLDAKLHAGTAAVAALADLLPTPEPGADCVVPLPPALRAAAGPHLATVLARRAARDTSLPLVKGLRQVRPAHRQRQLSLPDRRRNVDDLFRARRDFAGRHVLLVDDVLTSGSTAVAAARCLKRAGAKRVDGLFLCRTP